MKRLITKLLVLADSVRFLPFNSTNIQFDLNVPYVAATPGNCGIACAMMILKSKGKTITEAEFIDLHKTADKYEDPVGWKHEGLVKIIQENGVVARKFAFKSLGFVIDQLQQGHPVIVSVQVPAPANTSVTSLYDSLDYSLPLEGHLCVVKGFADNHFIIHDSRNIGPYQAELKVPKEIFAKVFSGRGIQMV